MNESAFLHRFIGVSVALFIAVAPAPASSAEETKQPLPPPPLAYTKADQPSWLPRVLSRLTKKKGWILKDHRLFRQAGKPTFLALIWNTRRDSGVAHMELYKARVISQTDVRLNLVQDYMQTSLSIEEPSGHDIGGDGVPFLALRYASLGSSHHGYGVRVYRLVGNSVDVTPDWAGLAKRMLVLDGGKSLALIVHDTRWAGYFRVCAACGPFFDIVMTWTPKGFRPACRSHPGYYEKLMEYLRKEWATWEEKLRKKSIIPHPRQIFEDFIETEIIEAFSLLQMGRIEEGQARYGAALEKARARGAGGWGIAEKFFEYWLFIVEKDFGPAVAAASAHPEYSCPLMAYKYSGSPTGPMELIDLFRYKPEYRP